MADDEERERRKEAQALKLMEEEMAKTHAARKERGTHPGDAKAALVAEYNKIYLDGSGLSEADTEFETKVQPIVNVFSCGWMEDGRLGYRWQEPCYNMPDGCPSHIQHSPRPVESMRQKYDAKRVESGRPFYVAKLISAGTRHSLALMINISKDPQNPRAKTKMRKVMMCGLNQLGLSEEKGLTALTDVPLDVEEVPIRVIAGHGTSFIITKVGNLYSFGQDKCGVLGHGDRNISLRVPRQVMALNRRKIKSVATGMFHTLALDDERKVWGWGKNHKGQCGLRFESDAVLQPTELPDFHTNQYPLQMSCGQEHNLCLVKVLKKDGTSALLVYSWGDWSRGQMGSGHVKNRHTPQENKELMRYIEKNLFGEVKAVAAGGYHNVILTTHLNYVITYGAGDYGQLGHGWQWDDPKPKKIPMLAQVFKISAGWRHTTVIKRTEDGISQVFSWGYNGYGELGLGDTQIRTVPTALTCFKRNRIRDISAGPKHTLYLAYHKPLVAKQEPELKQYFAVMEEGVSTFLIRRMKSDLTSKGLDPKSIDNPDAIIEGQPGSTAEQAHNDLYEPGLRYCMDTVHDPKEWRRKGYEACYASPALGMVSICLACARHCHKGTNMFLRVRPRPPGAICDCSRTKYCVCSFNDIRKEFDIQADRDGNIGPNKIRPLLQALRGPAPIEESEVEECMMALGSTSDERKEVPRIVPIVFERWYKFFYSIFDEDEALG